MAAVIAEMSLAPAPHWALPNSWPGFMRRRLPTFIVAGRGLILCLKALLWQRATECLWLFGENFRISRTAGRYRVRSARSSPARLASSVLRLSIPSAVPETGYGVFQAGRRYMGHNIRVEGRRMSGRIAEAAVQIRHIEWQGDGHDGRNENSRGGSLALPDSAATMAPERGASRRARPGAPVGT